MDDTDTGRLADLLDRCQELAPVYGPGYATHLPMALEALHGLGADAARLERFHARHAARLPRRGDDPAFEAGRARFVAQIAAQGREATLRATLPTLADHVAARLFHGVIRVAHAMAAGHDGELASGLAYWASPHEPLPPGVLAGAAESLSRWPPARDAEARVRDVASAAAAVYARGGDFRVLHAVTGSHAAWRLLPYADDPQAFARHLAVAVGWVLDANGGAPAPPAASPGAALPAWPVIVARARDADDEHVVKLTHACWRLAGEGLDEDPGDRFRAAAARAVGAA